MQSLAVNTAASGAASTITLPTPAAGEQNVIDWVACSYAAAPSAGILTITNCANSTGSAVTFSVDITAAGAAIIHFGDRGLRGILATAMVINLTDGGQAKDLNVQYR